MPRYDYNCEKDGQFELIQNMSESHDSAVCPHCGKKAVRVFTVPALQTDTNFIMTGSYDDRLGCKIEGRKHWGKKLREKGLMEIDLKEMKNATTYTAQDRMKKAGLGVGSIDIKDCLR